MSHAPYGPMPAGPPNWPSPPEPTSSRGHSRLPIISSIGIALAAVAIAIGSWFRPIPTPDAPPLKTYSAQEVADAKKAVCGAYEKVRATLEITGGKSGATSTDLFLIAINTRLALVGTSAFLTNALERNAAAPTELVRPVRELAGLYQQIALAQLSDATETDLAPIALAADAAIGNIQVACE